MKIAMFSTKAYDRSCFEAANANQEHELVFYEPRLNAETVSLAYDTPAVCVFVQDELEADIVNDLAQHGTRLIALSSTFSVF